MGLRDFSLKIIRKHHKISCDVYLASRGIKNGREHLSKQIGMINDNISSLLTHVSAMVAATALLLAIFQDDDYLKYAILAEMFLYTIATFLLILNLPFLQPYPWTHDDEYESKDAELEALDDIYETYLARRYIYVYTAYMICILTMILAVIILIHFLQV